MRVTAIQETTLGLVTKPQIIPPYVRKNGNSAPEHTVIITNKTT